MNKPKIINISKKISENTAVWPGDTPVQIETTMSKNSGGMVNLTTLRISAHTATHVDAPYHVVNEGKTIDQVDLNPFWGLSQVVTVYKIKGPLLPEDFKEYDLSLAPRLLVRTPIGQLNYDEFPEAIPYPSSELADFLKEAGIILYGTDTPSMDAIDTTELPGHQAIIKNEIAILEGLDLHLANDGFYELSALPLNIVGGDGSPVRAALRPLNETH
jgi:arylformamidase